MVVRVVSVMIPNPSVVAIDGQQRERAVKVRLALGDEQTKRFEYKDACARFLFGCFNGSTPTELKKRAEAMFEARDALQAKPPRGNAYGRLEA